MANLRGLIFIVADESPEASDRMIAGLELDCSFIRARTGEEALRFWTEFRIAGGLITETLPFAAGGAERLLGHLVEKGRRVVVLAEVPDPATAARWRERGAADVLLHPTRDGRRLALVRQALVRIGAGEGGE
jgi:hypothetical protein